MGSTTAAAPVNELMEARDEGRLLNLRRHLWGEGEGDDLGLLGCGLSLFLPPGVLHCHEWNGRPLSSRRIIPKSTT